MVGAGLAAAFARVALANVEREYPRKLDYLLTAPGELAAPRAYHPAFYGSYDWHSAVHMHWLLVRLLRLEPSLESEVAPVLERHLNSQALHKELAFFHGPGGATFERPYGWAWLLELQAELLRLGRWSHEVAPLAAALAGRLANYLNTSPYPVRSGAHGNSAFACVLALDYARADGDASLAREIEQAARRWYLGDRDYPVAYEPSADDFLSPALAEAFLMKRILPPGEFSAWYAAFLADGFGPLAHPPKVTDHADAKQSHLDGLCLSRAWCLAALGHAQLAQAHLDAGMPQVLGGDYVGEHWLATFAMLALSAEALKTP
ncbi:MAG TPA: DUF2891 domain-containing protein [Burkholderiales bacterium]|nr:DUF2891 domain-containing protein [Burkholderiales bacterium]